MNLYITVNSNNHSTVIRYMTFEEINFLCDIAEKNDFNKTAFIDFAESNASKYGITITNANEDFDSVVKNWNIDELVCDFKKQFC